MLTDDGGRVVNVLIGGIDLTRSPNRLATVLGSCIGLVIFDLDLQLAGMAHILLPDSRSAMSGPVGKYADRAVPTLVSALVEHGARRAALAAKYAGGARMFSRVTAGSAGDVGASNCAAVAQALAALRIPVAASDTGGPLGRKILFHPASGALDVVTLQANTAI